MPWSLPSSKLVLARPNLKTNDRRAGFRSNESNTDVKTLPYRPPVRTRVIEACCDPVIRVFEVNPRHIECLIRVPGVRHRVKMLDRPFDHAGGATPQRRLNSHVVHAYRASRHSGPEQRKRAKRHRQSVSPASRCSWVPSTKSP